jgi:hypothetical protein
VQNSFQVSRYKDICSAAAEALESWLPDECIFRRTPTESKMDDRTFAALSGRFNESHIFKQIGEHWLLRYPKDNDGIFGDCVGIQYFAKLLGNKNREMDVFEIEGIDDKRTTTSFSSEPVLDQEAIELVRDKIKDLNERIEYEMTHDGDEGKIEEMSREKEKYLSGPVFLTEKYL